MTAIIMPPTFRCSKLSTLNQRVLNLLRNMTESVTIKLVEENLQLKFCLIMKQMIRSKIVGLKESFMSIKITEKILSIPPYISTSWARIAGIHMKGSNLAVTLLDGDTVLIPNLNSDTIQTIFQHHALYLEKEIPPSFANGEISQIKNMMEPGEPSIRFAFGSSLEGLGSMMRHNPSQADAPDLPPEILQKIGAISKIIAPADEQLAIPKAEPNCNCFHCQIARAINSSSPIISEEEHQVTPEDLQFQEWSISQIGDKLYSVTNKLDEHERYNVYLGEPVGCTCGKTGCDHILAVLKS